MERPDYWLVGSAPYCMTVGGERTEMISKFRETIGGGRFKVAGFYRATQAAAASVCFASGGGLGF